jgi:tight adherence protein B
MIFRERFSAEHRKTRQRLGNISPIPDDQDKFTYSLLRDDKFSKIPFLHNLLSKMMFARNLQLTIQQSGSNMNAGTVILMMATVGVGALLVVDSLVNNIGAGFVAGVVGGFLPYMILKHKKKKRIENFEESLPDAVDMVANALKSGFSFESALRMVSQEMPDPLGTEFAITFEEQNLGVSFVDSLTNLRFRVPSDDLDLFITALKIHRRTGGNLAEVLTQTGATVRERFAFRGEVKSKTIHSRFSGLVLIVLPIALSLVILALNPEYFMVLLEDKAGNYLLGSALVMQLVGIFIIRKIVDIKI